MSTTGYTFRPIGIIRTGHTEAVKTPIQPVFADDCSGRAEVLPEFADGLKDVEGFSHLYLLYVFDRADEPRLLLKPFMQDVVRGVFATRAPRRPNAIGLSIVRLVRREGNVLYFQGADMLDGTPLLDIKPYTAKFDRIETTSNGWQDEVDPVEARRRGRRGYTGSASQTGDEPGADEARGQLQAARCRKSTEEHN